MKKFLPSDPSGYELANEDFGVFSVIVPEETINLITNPSFGSPASSGTTGYTAPAGSSISAVTTPIYTWYRSLEVTASAGNQATVYYSISNLSNTYLYTYSVFIKASSGDVIRIYATDNAGTRVGAYKVHRGNGQFTRVWITFQANSGSGVHRLYAVNTSTINPKKFYICGLQCEQKSYPTSYVDGSISRKYFSFTNVPDSPDVYWLSTPYESVSYRKAYSRLGGREYTFSDLGIKLRGVLGLGNIPSENVMDETNAGYTYYQRTIPRKRIFSLVGTIYGSSAMDIAAKRELLTKAVSPINNLYDTPIILRYNVLDRYGQICKIYDIECIYLSGLEGNVIGLYSDDITLQFEMADSYIKDYGEQCVESGLYDTLSPKCLGLLKRETDGDWVSALTSTGGTDYSYRMCNFGDYIYVAHGDNTVNGISDTEHCYRLNKITGVVEPLKVGMGFTNYVFCLCPDIAHDCIYIGGAFTNLDGVAANDYIVKYTVSTRTFSALGTAPDNQVSDIVLMSDGTSILVGGSFAQCGGVADTECLAKWDGSNWVSIQDDTWAASTTGLGPAINTICVDGNNIYIGGSFSLTGIADTDSIACLTPSGFVSVGGGITSPGVGGFNIVHDILKSSDGYLYIGGEYEGIGGISAIGFSRWNGTWYDPIAYELTYQNLGSPVNGSVFGMSERNGVLYVCGIFDTINGRKLAQSVFTCKNTVCKPINIIIDTNGPSPTVYQVDWDEYGNMYILTYGAVGDTVAGNISDVHITTPSTAKIYPFIEIIGPGKIYGIHNHSTNKAFHIGAYNELGNIIDNIFVLPSDHVTINFRKDSFGITSSRNSVSNKNIGDGSDIDWYLIPGNNYVSVLMYDDTAAETKFRIGYRETYLSLDSAIKENKVAK